MSHGAAYPVTSPPSWSGRWRPRLAPGAVRPARERGAHAARRRVHARSGVCGRGRVPRQPSRSADLGVDLAAIASPAAALLPVSAACSGLDVDPELPRRPFGAADSRWLFDPPAGAGTHGGLGATGRSRLSCGLSADRRPGSLWSPTPIPQSHSQGSPRFSVDQSAQVRGPRDPQAFVLIRVRADGVAVPIAVRLPRARARHRQSGTSVGVKGPRKALRGRSGSLRTQPLTCDFTLSG
jgi:hypothetical protein